MPRRRPDRAQTMRARRMWWMRHGAFARGMMVGILLALFATWIVRAVFKV